MEKPTDKISPGRRVDIAGLNHAVSISTTDPDENLDLIIDRALGALYHCRHIEEGRNESD